MRLALLAIWLALPIACAPGQTTTRNAEMAYDHAVIAYNSALRGAVEYSKQCQANPTEECDERVVWSQDVNRRAQQVMLHGQFLKDGIDDTSLECINAPPEDVYCEERGRHQKFIEYARKLRELAKELLGGRVP